MVWKKVPWFEIFSLILAENPLFFPDFPDRWEPCNVFDVLVASDTNSH